MRRAGRARGWALLAVAIAILAWCHAVRAEDVPQPGAKDAWRSGERPPPEPSPAPFRVGVLGGIGFPQPLAVEGVVVLGGYVVLGAEYAALPSTTFSSVHASLWSLSGDARLFPFGGAFFVGLRAGHQRLTASARITVESIVSLSEELVIDSWFLNPRVGFLWRLPVGLAFGVDAGIEIPVSAAVSSTLPLSLLPSAQNTIDAIANGVVPTIDILRVGLIL